jgi:hypothetical protein
MEKKPATAPMPTAPEEPEAGGPFAVPHISGWAMAPDGKTLIIATGSAGKLVYIDTFTGKEGPVVELDFQPGYLAAQADMLIAATKGGADLHILDLMTGREQKTIKLPGKGFIHLACHPTKGYVYAAGEDGVIYGIDPKVGKVWKTSAFGTMIVVDPVDGKFIYAATHHRFRDSNLILRRVSLVRYKVVRKELLLVSGNTKAGLSARAMAVTPDGSKVAAISGLSVLDHEGHFISDIPVFDSKNLATMAGRIDTSGALGRNIAFHPVLKLGVAERTTGELVIFRSTSLAKLQTLKVPNVSFIDHHSLLTFGGQGRFLVYGGTVEDNKSALIRIIPLELTGDQRDELKSATWGAPAE